MLLQRPRTRFTHDQPVSDAHCRRNTVDASWAGSVILDCRNGPGVNFTQSMTQSASPHILDGTSDNPVVLVETGEVVSS